MAGKLWKPQLFQGNLKKKRYFEGWYFKNVDKPGEHACAVIPGIALSPENPHAFIQVFDRALGTPLYFQYPVGEFASDPDQFKITIAGSGFSGNSMHLDCDDGKNKINGELHFAGTTPWPVSLFSPGAMGPFRFVPFMECYHGVLSFDHGIEGSLAINGHETKYTGGRGYIEKDWGVSMPSGWIWIQSNHFQETGVSFFCSVATIPWLGGRFRGFIIGLHIHGRLHWFATYTGARINQLHVDGNNMKLEVHDQSRTLLVHAAREVGADLPAPREGKMTSHVNESLKSTVTVALNNRKTGDVIFSGTGVNAGVEFAGEYEAQI